MKPFIVCAVLHQCGAVQVSSSGRVFRDPAGRTVLFQLRNGNKTHTPIQSAIRFYSQSIFTSPHHKVTMNVTMCCYSICTPCGSTGSTPLPSLRSVLYILLYGSAAITPLHATPFIMLLSHSGIMFSRVV